MDDGWQFSVLDRKNKVIVQDAEFYHVAMNTGLLIRILIGIL